MEITWYGRTCVRMRGRDAVVVADAYPAVVGPTYDAAFGLAAVPEAVPR